MYIIKYTEPYMNPRILDYELNCGNIYTIGLMIQQIVFPNNAKWTENVDIDNVTIHPTNFGKTQIKQLLKLRTNQYMGNARKQLFFGNIRFLNINCTLCTLNEVDTWKHVLLTCTEQHIHTLHINRHNKAVNALP